ncbi:alpha/beta hydrolase [Flavobacterium sp. 316]|uniref:alpha/beta fold hydrolase n=1 Tax=Flavobacterium sp. 316 TaxID=1603293 RepID=UPI0005DAFE8E|nr:alpha/beta fold hydrolase [Flavobacterium sp. 316]KIX20903.1 alpha/beta hydrolase [Flavobacterium sp. 316]
MIFSKIEGEGKPFLIIHGFLGMSDNWKTLGVQFAEQGFQVHLLDMRNHGRSFHSDDFNYQLMAKDVLEYCNFHQLKDVVLLGHSMGGKVAMEFACLYPEYVNKFIVADIGPKYYAPHHQDILAGLSAIDFETKPTRGEVDEILSKYISDFGTRQFLLKNLYWKEQGQLAFRFNLKALIANIVEIGKPLFDAAKFEKEVLFIRGGNSKYILDEDVPLIENQFPSMKLRTIDNAGHWLHAEQPKAFYDYVIEFIK